MRNFHDYHQSREYATYLRNYFGWKSIEIETETGPILIYLKKIGFLTFAKITRLRLPLPLKMITEQLEKHRVFYTKFDLLNTSVDEKELKKYGFYKDHQAVGVTSTIFIDLSPTPDKILQSFKRARSWIKKMPDVKLDLNQFELFFKIWKSATKIQHIWSSDHKDYQTLIESFGDKIFCLTYKDLCGVLVLMHDRVALYYYAAALPEAKEQDLPYLMVWQAILEAKKRGCDLWDWHGIFDQRYPNKKWRGFTQFKRTFGGTEVPFAGTFIRWRFKYLLPFFKNAA